MKSSWRDIHKIDARWAPLLFAGLSFTRTTAVWALTTPITMRSPRARLRWTSPSLSIPIPPASKSRIALTPAPPARIVRWMNRHPGLKVIVCHLGGFQWEDAVNLDAFFDISAILSDYADRFGIQKTNEILRAFGPEKLLFATDWPCSRSVAPDDIVMQYLAILDQMDFSTEEMHQIAHRNAEELFHIHINR